MKICDIENAKPIKAQISASVHTREVAAANTTALAMIAKELTMPQKSTFAKRSVVALTGNSFAFSAVLPSRVMFVAQKVFVRMLKMRSTKSAKGKFTLNPIAFLIKDSNKV